MEKVDNNTHSQYFLSSAVSVLTRLLYTLVSNIIHQSITTYISPSLTLHCKALTSPPCTC